MMPRPTIFISAVSKELAGARDLVAKVLVGLGYEPVWQDVFGTEQGDLRTVLRKKIDASRGVIQLVGYQYGSEPPVEDKLFGRVSYTQFEALYARRKKKKVWYLIDTTPPPSTADPGESAELRRLQAQYRQSIQAGTDVFYEVDLKNDDAVKITLHQIEAKLENLRRAFRLWTASVTALLTVILGLVVWGLVKQPPSSKLQFTEERANAAFIAKNYAAAFDAYAHLSDSDPTNIRYHRRIEECARSGRLEKPFLERYFALVRTHPSNAVFHNYLGNAYLLIDSQDQDNKAREQYETALKLNPNFAPPLINLAIVISRMSDPTQAEPLFKQYLERSPDDAVAWTDLGLYYAKRVEAATNDTQAIQLGNNALEKAIQIEPGLASAYKGLGRIFAATDQKTEALQAFQRSLALDYEQPEVRRNVELLAWESGQSGATVTPTDDFRTRSLKETRATTETLLKAMKALDENRHAEAETLSRKLLQQQPNNPLAIRLLGRALTGLGRTNEAHGLLVEAVRLAKQQLRNK